MRFFPRFLLEILEMRQHPRLILIITAIVVVGLVDQHRVQRVVVAVGTVVLGEGPGWREGGRVQGRVHGVAHAGQGGQVRGRGPAEAASHRPGGVSVGWQEGEGRGCAAHIVPVHLIAILLIKYSHSCLYLSKNPKIAFPNSYHPK